MRRGVGMLAAAILAAASTVAAPDLIRPAAATTQTFGVGTHSFVVPAGVTSITATVTGARGGAQSGIGGGGAMVPATAIAVTPGETLTIHVGGQGGNGSTTLASGAAGASGFAAGASGGTGGTVLGRNGGGGGGGGGASAVVQAGTPRIVAGGGGGGAGHGVGCNLLLICSSLQGGNGGNANANGSTAPTVQPGAGGTCCSNTSRNGAAGASGAILPSGARGGGGGGGGGYDGGTNGGGGGGATGGYSLSPAIGGAGGGGAGGRSWLLGSRYTPTSFNTGNINGGNGQVVLAYTASTTTTLVSSLNPSLSGQSVAFTATVVSGAGAPTGTVTFFDGGTQIGGPVTLADGVATFVTSTLSEGNHQITAVYGGSADFTTSTSNVVVQTVIAPVGGLRLTTVADPVAVGAAGETIAYTASVTNTGNVTVDGLGIADAPVAPAGPVPSITCTPSSLGPGGSATCTGTYMVTAADIASASAEVFRTFTAVGTNAVSGVAVESNPFAVSVDVRTALPGWSSALVNTSNTVGVTP